MRSGLTEFRSSSSSAASDILLSLAVVVVLLIALAVLVPGFTGEELIVCLFVCFVDVKKETLRMF
jgi:hypothetical protein